MEDPKKIKISIIIACLNAEKKIEKSIQSIISQNYPDTEIIVIDGNSKDRTLDILKSHSSSIYKLISENDSGIGDAWNKGLSYANGDLIGILNAGDYYDMGTFSKIVKSFRTMEGPAIGYGDTTFFDEHNIQHKHLSKHHNSKLALLNGFGFMHPSVFFTSSVVNEIGNFDVKKRIAVDSDWLIRAKVKNVTFFKIPNHTFMEIGGLSMIYPYTGMGEYMDSLVKYGFKRYYIILFFLFRLLGAVKNYLIYCLKKIRLWYD